MLAGAAVVFALAFVWTVDSFGADSVGTSLAVVWLPMTWVGMASRVAQVRLPERYHAQREWERSGRIYEYLGVRVVKSLLRRGPLAVFNPDLHLPAERSPERLEHLAQRMRDAEASHAVLFAATLPIVGFALVRGWWTAAVWTFVFDVMVNGYPAILQRYNRALLARRFAMPDSARSRVDGAPRQT